MKILFLFKNSKHNIKLAEKKLFPKLFYGYFELIKNNDVQFMDTIEHQGKIARIYNKFFRNFKPLEDKLLSNIKLLNQYDIIYATTDGIAIEVAKLKKEGLLKVKVVANIMSIADNDVQTPYLYLLNYLDGLICFSKKIEQYLNKNNIKNATFIEYGVDTKFYNKTNENPNNMILSIGLDRFRDWNCFIEVAKILPDIEFRVITSNNNKKLFTLPNVTFLGNTNFIETRNEMSEAKLIFLPTRPNYYFSGQTTLFNALSMNKNVLMPLDANFNGYNFDESMFYDRDDRVEIIANKIERLLQRDPEHNKPTINCLLIRNKFNQANFAYNINFFFRKVLRLNEK
jgi:hypothetical protein